MIIKKVYRKIRLWEQKIKLYFQLLFISFAGKKTTGLKIPDIKIWLKNFRKMALHFANTKYLFSFVKEFLESDIQIEKKIGFKENSNLIAICVIRNDIEKLKVFLEHHRKLGVNQFAFLDDKSADGTREFLLAQNDVELFKSSESFQTVRKTAWIDRILAYYGLNRWYLALDSDELLVYDDFENKSIVNFVDSLQKENMSSASGIMVDMYPKELNLNQTEKNNIYDGIDYFDKSGYFLTKYSMITGGMRYRCLGAEVFLEKTPLFFLDKETVYLTHDIFPLEKNFQKNKKSIALLHYKFLSEDIENYKDRIEKNAMAEGCRQYKIYMEKIDSKNAVNFYDENVSEKFTGANSLIKHNLLEKI